MNKREKFFEWLKKNWLVTLLIISFIYLVVVHILFKLSAPMPFLVATWSSADALGYGGSIIGAIATIYVFQETLNVNRKSLNEERSFLLRPYFTINARTLDWAKDNDVTDISNPVLKNPWSGNIDIALNIENVGAGNAVNVKALIDQPNTQNTLYETNRISSLIIGAKQLFVIKKCHASQLNIILEYDDIACISKYQCSFSVTIRSNGSVVSVNTSIPEIKKIT